MLENLSLKKLSIYILIILFFIAGTFTAATLHLNLKVNEINTAWHSFKSQHAEKARLETSLSATLGYGGMIHDFKNYILRKEFKQLSNLQKTLGAAQSIVEQYVALSTTRAEKLVLDDINQMITHYHEGLLMAREAIKQNKTSKEIDQLVRIDDSFALRGLNILHEEIVSEYEYYNDRSQKPVLANLIRTKMGYGGMIHSFKNYVLRGDEKFLLKSKESIQDAKLLIQQYYATEHSLGEKTALEDIEKTLSQYQNKLDTVTQMIKNNFNPNEIDEAVRINDKHALRGLKTLDHDIILQIENKSGQLGESLESIKTNETYIALFIVIIILSLAIYLYILFSKRIIQPVQELSAVMSEIAHGNLNINFNYPDNVKTELGDMARSLKVFKANEKKRRIAEDEVRRLALTDPLTGLANRNQLEYTYEDMAALGRREKRLIAIFALDLDKFKPINDQYGHAAGDAVLEAVARNLLLAFRETDLVARTGGDEFLVIFYGPENMKSLTDIAQRVINLLATPVPFENELLSIGTSIGISIHEPNNTDSMEAVMKRADKALYEAKMTGRNKYCIDGDIKSAEKIIQMHQKKPLFQAIPISHNTDSIIVTSDNTTIKNRIPIQHKNTHGLWFIHSLPLVSFIIGVHTIV